MPDVPTFNIDTYFSYFLIGGVVLVLVILFGTLIRHKFKVIDVVAIDEWNKVIDALPDLAKKNGWKKSVNPTFDLAIEHYPAGLPPGKSFNRLFFTATKNVQGRDWTLLQSSTWDPPPQKPNQGMPTLSFVTKLNGALPGWVRVRPDSSSYAYERTTDHRLEAERFNQTMDIRGTSLQLAYHVLTPDFMDWLDRIRPRRWVTIEGNIFIVTYESNPIAEGFTNLENDLQKALEYVERSGALRK